MPEKMDVVIFGASGFTGKYVVREFLKFLSVGNDSDGEGLFKRRIMLAGRSKRKLAEALSWASSPAPPPALPLMEANVNDPSSLSAMCSMTKLVLNCVGPFRLYGEPVVAACVEHGTAYLDISGEPEFMERMADLYHDAAMENAALIVSACGYDCIPAEIGLLHHLRYWEAPSLPNSVDAFLELRSSKKITGNLGTYESAILSFSSAKELRRMRQKKKNKVRVRVPGMPAMKSSLILWNEELKMWTVFLPSADSAVIRRTMTTIASGGPPSILEEEEGHSSMAMARRLQYIPVNFSVFSATPSIRNVLAQIWLGLSIVMFALFAVGRWLLLRFPSFFSCGLFEHGGPSEEQVNAASFKLWFIGKGYSDSTLATTSPSLPPDMQILTVLSGPEIGYITTPICLVQCALIVLDQRSSLPGGGVYTPGVVFGTTDLQQRLQANGLSFDFISRKSK